MASSPGLGEPLLGQLSSSGTDVMPILRSSFLKDWASQAAWTSEAYTGLVRTWDAHASDRLARLRQVFCGPHTGVWLTAVPRVTHGRSFFAAAEFQALLKWRLSLPLGGVGQCAGCASPCDLLGDHALCCSSLGMYRRHNCIRDLVVDLLSQCGMNPRTEVSLPGSEDRPADVFIPSGWGSHPVAVDVSVVHSLSATWHHSEALAGRAATKREQDKLARYQGACTAAGWTLLPVVAETTGAWGTHAQRFFSRLARRAAMCTGAPLKEVSAGMWTSLSTELARSVAGMLLGSIPTASGVASACAQSTFSSASRTQSPLVTRNHPLRPPTAASSGALRDKPRLWSCRSAMCLHFGLLRPNRLLSLASPSRRLEVTWPPSAIPPTPPQAGWTRGLRDRSWQLTPHWA